MLSPSKEEKKNRAHLLNLNSDALINVLDQSGLCYSLKDKNLSYLYTSKSFDLKFQRSNDTRTDYGLFKKSTAYTITYDDNICFTSQVKSEVYSVVYLKSGEHISVKIDRSIVNVSGLEFLLSIYHEVADKELITISTTEYKEEESEVFETILNRFSTLIFSQTKRKDIFFGVAQLCIDVLDLEDFAIFIYDKKRDVLPQVLVAQKESKFKWIEEDDLIELNIGQGITGKCAKLKKTILVEDTSKSSVYIKDKNSGVTELAVPIIHKNTLLGVIDTESTLPGRYDVRISKILEGIASLLAIKLNELISYEDLELRKNVYSSVIRNNPTCLALLDDKFRYIEISDRWNDRFVKGKIDNIKGKNHFELYPNIPLRWKKDIEGALKGKSASVDRETYYRQNGEIGIFRGQVSPWYKSKGEVGGVLIMVEIITEQVEGEMMLSKTSEDLREARKLGRIFTWEYLVDEQVLKWNGNKTIPGIQADVYHDKDILFNHIDSKYHDDLHLSLGSLQNGAENFSIIHPFKVENRTYWFHNRGKGVYRDGKLQKIEGLAQDITVQVDAEKIYKRQNRELKKVNSELDQFVYKTVHDLRAPLTNLLGLLGLMRSEADRNILASYFDLQEKSIERLDTFVQKITTYTKNKRLPIENKPIDFKRLIDNVLNDHNFIQNSERATKIVEIEKNAVFYGDIERLSIILNNLVSNAVKFIDLSKENSLIRINISTAENKTKLVVWDNGQGIPSSIQPKIFEMFYRGNKQADGAGIGLYILKETVESLGGSISLSSVPEEFTEFTIYLPNISTLTQHDSSSR